MSRPELPADLRRFIVTSIPSVPYLEAVLLLRSEPDPGWSASQMARRLYLPEADAAALLEAAVASGLARAGDPAATGGGGRYRFEPATPELEKVVARLASHYSVDMVAVAELIHSRVDKRAQQFADAFRWRKEP